MARLMKDSGIEWIGEIPEEWAVSKVKYFIDCYDGRRVPVDAGERVSGPYPYWGAGSITDYVDSYLFDEELILLGEDGAPFFDPTRPVAFLVNEKIWVNNHIHVLKPHSDVYPAYLLHFLNTVDYKTYINGSILNKLTQSNMNSIAFVVPTYDEQQRIADFLDSKCAEIDAVIEKTKATIEEYKKLKQSVITEAVTKGIRGARPMKDSGIEWIGEICDTYQVYRLKHLVSEALMYGANESGIPFEADLPRYIRITDITLDGHLKDEGKLSLPESVAEPYLLKNNDILFARSGATVGKAFIYKQEYGRAAFAGYLIKASVNELVCADYVFYYTQSSLYEEWKKQIFVQATIQNIGADRYNNLPVILPDVDEQHEIIAYLDKKCAVLDALIAKKTALLTELETYKKSLIYEYVTGKKEIL